LFGSGLGSFRGQPRASFSAGERSRAAGNARGADAVKDLQLPGVKAGIFTCELHPARGFPGV
jgi:hypothetical protein